MLHWGTGAADGVVTYEEFEDHYKGGWRLLCLYPLLSSMLLHSHTLSSRILSPYIYMNFSFFFTIPILLTRYIAISGVSSSIDNEDYFEVMIRNAWRMAGGEVVYWRLCYAVHPLFPSSCAYRNTPTLLFSPLLIVSCPSPFLRLYVSVYMYRVALQGQAANTANRRVLVTDKNGNQSVQTIKDELGMKAKDMGDIKRRLGSQGVDTSHVEMYGQADNKMDKPSNTVWRVRIISSFLSSSLELHRSTAVILTTTMWKIVFFIFHEIVQHSIDFLSQHLWLHNMRHYTRTQYHTTQHRLPGLYGLNRLHGTVLESIQPPHLPLQRLHRLEGILRTVQRNLCPCSH